MPEIVSSYPPEEIGIKFDYYLDSGLYDKLSFINYRGVGQTRTMEIAKKSSELAQPVRVSPTMPVKFFWRDMEFLI